MKNKLIKKEFVFQENKVLNHFIADGHYEVEIYVNDNVEAEFNRTGEVEDFLETVTIHIGNNSKIKYHDGIKVTGKYESNLKTIVSGNNSVVDIAGGYVVNDQAELFINSDAVINKDTNNSNFDEIYRVLLLGSGAAKILPNMLISNNNIIANHGVTISGISKDYLFYLNSHGVKDSDAIELIKRSIAYKYIDITNYK